MPAGESDFGEAGGRADFWREGETVGMGAS